MAAETVMPSPLQPPVDFNFDSACTTPYISAPSSPQHFSGATTGFHGGTVPFSWEERPGIPKSKRDVTNEDGDEGSIIGDYAFEFSGPLEKTCFSSADELFDSGKIKPLKPTLPRLQYDKDFDGFAPDANQLRRSRGGRETRSCSNNPRHKATRSLSPFRASDLVFDQKPAGRNNQENNNNCISSSFISTVLSGRWKLKDLLLFRSASEGRASSTAQKMNKYAYNNNKKKSSSESNKEVEIINISEAGSISRRRRRGPVSAHELHYTMNRTISEELKRKTFLPYNRGLLGCLGFNPAVHEISSRGFSSMSSSMARS